MSSESRAPHHVKIKGRSVFVRDQLPLKDYLRMLQDAASSNGNRNNTEVTVYSRLIPMFFGQAVNVPLFVFTDGTLNQGNPVRRRHGLEELNISTNTNYLGWSTSSATQDWVGGEALRHQLTTRRSMQELRDLVGTRGLNFTHSTYYGSHVNRST